MVFYSHAVPAVPLLLLGFLTLEGRTVVSPAACMLRAWCM